MSCAPVTVSRKDPGELPPELARERADEELIMHLEPDQLVAATTEPVAPAPLGPRAKALLWGLRIFVVLVSLMVVYTFVDRLH